jgi:FkbM family methyltransferase
LACGVFARPERNVFTAATTDRIVSLINRVPGPVAKLFRTDSPVARAVRPLVNRLVPKEPTWIVVRSGEAKGVKLLIDPKTEKFLWSGLHERAVQEAIVRLLKPGMTFWDVGAHVGFFTILAGKLVGDSGHVHAFEPMPENRRRLEAAVEANGSRNVSVHEVAVSASSGEGVLYAHASSCMWSVRPDPDGDEGIVVPFETLDRLSRSTGPPDVVKIDAEGAELDVLRGGVGLLENAKPSLIVELSDASEARSLLPDYEFERIDDAHWLLSPRPGQTNALPHGPTQS